MIMIIIIVIDIDSRISMIIVITAKGHHSRTELKKNSKENE